MNPTGSQFLCQSLLARRLRHRQDPLSVSPEGLDVNLSLILPGNAGCLYVNPRGGPHSVCGSLASQRTIGGGIDILLAGLPLPGISITYVPSSWAGLGRL